MFLNRFVAACALRYSPFARKTDFRAGVWVGKNARYQGATLLPPLCLGSDVRIGKGARLGPHVVVGSGCQIGNEARITNSILMEHCRIAKRAEIVESIIGPHSEIAEMVKLPAKTTLGAYSQVGDNFQTRRIP